MLKLSKKLAHDQDDDLLNILDMVDETEDYFELMYYKI